jgi:hypothetical protein
MQALETQRPARAGACGDASTAQFVAGGTRPAKQRARTRQELKKRVGVCGLGCLWAVAGLHAAACMFCHAAVTSVQLASWPGRAGDALRAACVGRR